jgi:hypothetical protein
VKAFCLKGLHCSSFHLSSCLKDVDCWCLALTQPHFLAQQLHSLGPSFPVMQRPAHHTLGNENKVILERGIYFMLTKRLTLQKIEGKHY